MYCANCGTKVPENSKFCPKCGGNAVDKSSSEKSEKEKKPRRRRTLIYIAVVFGVLIIVPLIIFYFVGVSNFKSQYKHPILGFTFDYPKTLNVETPKPTDYKCPNEPCFVVLKNPSYNNEVVNWVAISSVSSMAKNKTDLQAGLDGDVSKGLATAMTVNGIKMNKYINNPDKPTNVFLTIGKMLGLDPSQEKFMYIFIMGDSGLMVAFKTPPTEAPADYNLYLDIQSWKNPTATK